MQRLEIEFTVGNFESAKTLLWALGYEVTVWYEKYRTTYQWKDVLVTIDEMPYGDFSDMEGPDAETIQSAAKELGLRWEARILESYLGLFDRLRQNTGLPAKNLGFAELAGTNCNPQMLAYSPPTNQARLISLLCPTKRCRSQTVRRRLHRPPG